MNWKHFLHHYSLQKAARLRYIRILVRQPAPSISHSWPCHSTANSARCTFVSRSHTSRSDHICKSNHSLSGHFLIKRPHFRLSTYNTLNTFWSVSEVLLVTIPHLVSSFILLLIYLHWMLQQHNLSTNIQRPSLIAYVLSIRARGLPLLWANSNSLNIVKNEFDKIILLWWSQTAEQHAANLCHNSAVEVKKYLNSFLISSQVLKYNKVSPTSDNC